jgi:ferredoxin--NADP+ reductase
MDGPAMTAAAIQVSVAPVEIERLRTAQYNAMLTEVLPVHSDLRILRVVPDGGVPTFEPGQFLSLGLGKWEPRVEGVDEEQINAVQHRRLAKRAYSISCSVLDAGGALRTASEFPYLEFYVALVRRGRKRPPSLTPRLFALQPGDRLFVERHAAGGYTLATVQTHQNVFFFATGTGEAPHNAMIAELLTRGHRGQIISVVSVRHSLDAAYRACHEQLVHCYSNYGYVVLTTRELQAGEPWTSPTSCRCHLQDLVASTQLERHTGVALDPENAQVFLCGNPEMIGTRQAAASASATGKPGSMLDILLKRGFQVGKTGQPGNVHFERYW